MIFISHLLREIKQVVIVKRIMGQENYAKSALVNNNVVIVLMQSQKLISHVDAIYIVEFVKW